MKYQTTKLLGGLNPRILLVLQPLAVLLLVMCTQQPAKTTGVVLYKSYAKDDVDFSSLLTDVKRANPDVLFLPDYYQKVGLIAKKAREMGITAKLLGGDGWDSPDMVKIAGEAIEGGYFTNHYSPEDQRPEVQEFVRKYTERHGSKPDALATLGYDATRLLIEALRRAGPDTIGGKKAPSSIRIGLIAPLTGDVKTFGESTRNGFELAIAEANAVGDLPKLEPIVADDKNDPTECANAGSKLINQDGVRFIVGSVASKCSNPLSDICQAAGVVMISSASTNPLVTVGANGVRKNFVFRACYIDPFQGAVAAKFARENLKAKTAAVLYDVGNDYSRGLAEYFRKKFEEGATAPEKTAAHQPAPAKQPPASETGSYAARVRDALAGITDFPTVSGRISFDENGNPRKSAVILEYRGGEQKYVATITP